MIRLLSLILISHCFAYIEPQNPVQPTQPSTPIEVVHMGELPITPEEREESRIRNPRLMIDGRPMSFAEVARLNPPEAPPEGTFEIVEVIPLNPPQD